VVTIKDVAARAGVGAGTVSRVLNDSPAVSPATRDRVLNAMAALDYRPNPLAQRLSRGHCQTLGVVVPFFTHASAVERLRGVVSALSGSRYDLVLFNVESPVHRDEHFAALSRRGRADGLLVMSLEPPAPDLARLITAEMPIILVDARAASVPMVITDDVQGGRIATQHLLDLGHRRIAFIGDRLDNPLGFRSSADRERGYADCLAGTGQPRDPRLTRHGPHDRAVAQTLAEDLLSLENRPTAVFASSDVQATGVLAAAQRLGLRVPEDLSVIGFDDIEIASYAGLTTVHQPLFESGRIGAELLLQALVGERLPAPEVHQIPLRLVERATTAPIAEKAA
jgi:DNA-binding LacI/PurR family transcriptional regulator